MSTLSPAAPETVLGTPAAVVSVSPITLPAPGRAVDLQLRVTAPATGQGLPIVLLSHGQGRSLHLSSLDGYAPMADFWAAHGFAVIQPTHLSSATLRLDPDDPEAPMYWRSRARDMTRILDELDAVEAAVPSLAGRLDRGRVAVAGHSMGGNTASLLLGARTRDAEDASADDLADPRITAGVLLAAPGRGGDGVTASTREHHPFLSLIDFSTMTTPALVVAGDADASPHLTDVGPGWHTDPYHLGSGPMSLLTLFGAEHGLGGVSGYDVAETTDEDPARLAVLQELTAAYLRTALSPGDRAWGAACQALAAAPDPQGDVVSKGASS